MTSTLYTLNNPPIKGSAYTFPVILFSQADTKDFKTSPTLAAGDVLVGYEGQEPTAQIASLPTSTTSGRLEVSLSAAEMNHNQVTVKFRDAAGAEWCALMVTFQTVTAATVAASDPPSAADIWSYASRSLTTFGTLIADTWAYSTRTLTGFGTLVADVAAAVWAYASRTLTQSAVSTSNTTTAEIERARGDTWGISLTGLGSNTGYVSLDFSIKQSPADADTAAVVRIRKNASGTGDGLLYLNGAAPVSPVVAGDGSITVVSSTALTIALAARATDDLDPGEYMYDVQLITASAVSTLASGAFVVTADITRAVS